MIEKKANTRVAIHELLATRWSGRAYDASRQVGRSDVLALLEAARWAPSCFGDQPWRILVCDRFSDEQAWQQLLQCLVEGNMKWAQNAPLLLAVLADDRFTHNDKPNRWGGYDTGAAAMSICVQATALGLMVHQMGGFDGDRIRSAFSVPDRYMLMSVMAVGYQLSEQKIPEDMLDRELADRVRYELEQIAFAGQWGSSI